MSAHDSAKNIKDLIDKIKPDLSDMRGNHKNRIYEVNIRYDREEDEFTIITE